jgi:PAS domain S-box-containing protein
MLKRTFNKLFPDTFAGMAAEHRAAFARQTAAANLMRARVFAAILVAVMVPLVIVDLGNRSRGLWAEPGYRNLFLLHLVIAAVFLAYSAAAYLLRPKDESAVTDRHRVLVTLFAACGLLLPAAVSVNDQLIHGQITVYLMAAFWVAAGLTLDALTSFLLYAGSAGLMLAGIFAVQHDAGVLFGHAVNTPLLSLLAWLLSRSLYLSKERGFAQEQIILRQGQQVRELETRRLALEKEQLSESVQRVSRSLQESEAAFRALADTSPAAIIIHRGPMCLFANSAAAAVTGYPVPEVLAAEFWVLIHPEDRNAVRSWEQAATGGGGPASCECRVLRKSFEERWVLMTAARAEYEGLSAVITTMVDINDRMRLEGRLRHAQKMEAAGRAAEGVGHDLSRLLDGIAGEAHLLRRTMAEGDPRRRSVDQILAALERTKALTRSLLELGRKPQA